jgi:predicted anti-sigma-YlaC factor YlaD
MLIPIPPSECVGAREAASRRLDGELSELEAARLDAHLQRCSACREFAEEAAAIALELRRAPLEKPAVAAFEPLRRRPATMSRLQVAAAVLAVVAGAGSFALGRVVGGGGATPAATAVLTTGADLGSGGQDEIEQHLLALLPHLGPSRTPSVGSAVPL